MNEMTGKHRDGLKKIMEWYWKVAHTNELVSVEDYEFIYSLWNNGITTYDGKMQKRLNKIREIYNNTTLWT